MDSRIVVTLRKLQPASAYSNTAHATERRIRMVVYAQFMFVSSMPASDGPAGGGAFGGSSDESLPFIFIDSAE